MAEESKDGCVYIGALAAGLVSRVPIYPRRIKSLKS
jgi:hypothetical protein